METRQKDKNCKTRARATRKWMQTRDHRRERKGFEKVLWCWIVRMVLRGSIRNEGRVPESRFVPSERPGTFPFVLSFVFVRCLVPSPCRRIRSSFLWQERRSYSRPRGCSTSDGRGRVRRKFSLAKVASYEDDGMSMPFHALDSIVSILSFSNSHGRIHPKGSNPQGFRRETSRVSAISRAYGVPSESRRTRS